MSITDSEARGCGRPSGPAARFAAVRLGAAAGEMSAEIAAVRVGSDADAIHRLRVHTRRIGTILRLCGGAVPLRRSKNWRRETGAVRRALGRARDADVRTAFLRSVRPRAGVAAAARAAAEERRGMQAGVLRALGRFEASGVSGEMIRFAAEAGPAPGCCGVMRGAAGEIGCRLEAVLAMGERVRRSRSCARLHRLRIAVKRLRYLLELVAPVAPEVCSRAAARCREMQHLLGDVHDCDVWAGRFGERRAVPDVLRDAVRERRERSLGRFESAWRRAERDGLWKAVGALANEPPSACLLRALAAAGRARGFERGHSVHTTRLALCLFDEVRTLHRLGGEERVLLLCAGMLHDAGVPEDPAGHHLAAEDIVKAALKGYAGRRARTVAALVARYHRGREPSPADGAYGRLARGDRRRVRMLAGLLKLADALDTSHASAVRAVRVRTDGGVAVCECFTDGPPEPAERVAKKKRLLERALGLRVSVRWRPARAARCASHVAGCPSSARG